MERQVNLQRNEIFHLEDSMIIYGIYNSETIEKLINIIHHMLGMKDYLQVSLTIGINGIYLQKELYITL